MWASGAVALLLLGLADGAPAAEETVTLFATSIGTDTVNHRSDSVTIIDGPRGQVLRTLSVPRGSHGLAVLVEGH